MHVSACSCKSSRSAAHLDDLVVLLVRLANHALRPRIVQEAVVRERRHPSSDAVRPAVRIGADEHVKACERVGFQKGANNRVLEATDLDRSLARFQPA